MAAVDAGDDMDDMKPEQRHMLQRCWVDVLSVIRHAACLRYLAFPALLPSAVALLLGCLAALTLPRLPPVWVLWIFLFVGVMLAVVVRRVAWCGVVLFGLLTVACMVSLVCDINCRSRWRGRDLVLRGRIVSLPVPETRRTRFLLRVDTDQDQEPALRGRLLQLSWYDENKAVVPGPRSALHAGSVWQLHRASACAAQFDESRRFRQRALCPSPGDCCDRLRTYADDGT